MDGGQTLAFLCEAVCVFVGAVHRFRLWGSVSGKPGGEGKHISAEGDSIPVFLPCCIFPGSTGEDHTLLSRPTEVGQ